MPFLLRFTSKAKADIESLKQNPALKKRHKAVLKTLGLLEKNPRHPSLNTHKYQQIFGVNGEEVFEAYAENNTPQAYRIFWHYGPDRNMISIIMITPHP